MATQTRTTKIVWTSESSKLVGDFRRIQAEEARTEAGLRRIASAADTATRKQREMANAAVSRTGRTSYRDPNLAISPSGRMLARSGADGAFASASREVMLLRSHRAAELRGLRAMRTGAAAEAARAVRYAQAADMAGYGIGARRGVGNFDEDRTTARARRLVNRRLAQTPELAGKVSSEEMEQMVSRQSRALQRRTEMRQSAAQGALAVGGAVTAVAAAADARLTQYADKILSVEDELSGLYGVGQNPTARAKLRGAAIATSIGSGLPLADVADLRGRMESAFDEATIPADAKREAERSAILYRKLGVKDSTSTALGLGALYTTFGKDLGGGAPAMRVLANRLQLSQDVGAFDPDQVTPYLAMVGQSFKGAGYKDSDMFAALALASKTGMRPEAFATGSRNLSLLMMEGEKKGLKRTGNFATDVGQLSQLESPELLEIFGRDTFVIAKMFADNTALLGTYIKQQEALTGRMDAVGAKVGDMMADRAFVSADVIGSARQLAENAPAMNAEDPLLAEAVEDFELRKAGAEREIHPLFSWFKKPAAWLEQADSSLYQATDGYLGTGATNLRDAAARDIINAKRSEGNAALADYYELKYNPYGSQSYGVGDGRVKLTGADEAEEFRSLRNGGYRDLSASEFTQYKTMQATGNGDATAYLERVGKLLVESAEAQRDAARNLGEKARDRTAHD